MPDGVELSRLWGSVARTVRRQSPALAGSTAGSGWQGVEAHAGARMLPRGARSYVGAGPEGTFIPNLPLRRCLGGLVNANFEENIRWLRGVSLG